MLAADSRLCIPQQAMSTFDFQTSKYWIWVGVAYCLGLFVVFTGASAAALRFISPPHAQASLARVLNSILVHMQDNYSSRRCCRASTVGAEHVCSGRHVQSLLPS